MDYKYNEAVNVGSSVVSCPRCNKPFSVDKLQANQSLPVVECPHCLSRIELER